MMLADMGADVVRLDRPDQSRGSTVDVLQRGRRSIIVDLKQPGASDLVLKLVKAADVLMEGYRPGVLERLGLGPDACLVANPDLIYVRMTGWGQTGSLASQPGHDINYLALTGALHSIGRAGQPPTPPANLLADFGGGAMLALVGILAALVERARSGQGQVVDAAMIDGVSLLMTVLYSLHDQNEWAEERGTNLLDSGSPYYDVYETLDGRYISIGALEAKFFTKLLSCLGLDHINPSIQADRSRWPELRQHFADAFKTKTRDEWCRSLEQAGVCFAPVLSMTEAPGHPHNVARQVFQTFSHINQPSPAPRFGRTPGTIRWPPPEAGHDTDAVLSEWAALSDTDITDLSNRGILGKR
jgi:alpha-methylacyl-CoA racemase